MRVWRVLPLLVMIFAGVRPLAGQVPADSAAADTVSPGAPADTLQAEPGDSIARADSAAAGPQLDARADSILRLLRQLPGYTVTEYQGESASYRAETGTLQLEGNASVTRGTDQLTADTIIYLDSVDLVIARGNAQVLGQEQPITGDTLYYEIDRRRATAIGARTQVTESATWYVTGDVTLEGENRLFGREAHFTSCDLEIPHYHFEADEVMIIRNRILVARPARLYFGDVPVAVLPFIVQSLEQGRRSGFLTPRFGLNDIVRASSGYTRQVSDVGFYWAINDYLGALASMTWRSGAYTSLLGTLDFNWRRQFLRGSATVERYWQATGRRELSLAAQGSWQPDERTSMNLNARYASSSGFIRDVSYDPTQVIQNLNSSLSISRDLGWARVALGGDRQQSIANGDVTMTLPTFSFSPNAITLFRAPTPESARWYNNINITPGSISGTRSTSDYADNIRTRRQDRATTQLRAGPSISIGNFSFSTSAGFDRTEIDEASGVDTLGVPVNLPGSERDQANWSASASYRIPLIGTTSVAPAISWRQELVRDTLSDGELVGSPVRMSFGASLSTDLYGFFPGFGDFTAIRHRLSPRISYSYAPQTTQTPLQERVFGQTVGRTLNQITFGVNQTFEGKLRAPAEPERTTPAPGDTLAADSASSVLSASAPPQADKVTLLSITTSSFVYDFVKAREEGNGFTTQTVSNTISSDYLRGLTVQMQHELFDKSDLDPNVPDNVGKMGRFSPRLTSLSTSFELGPQTSIIRWIDRLIFGGGEEGAAAEADETEQVLPGQPESVQPTAQGQGAFTGNPMGTGGGPWRVSASYSLTRSPRVYDPSGLRDDRTSQTLAGNISFQLTPNWSVNWNTSYSLDMGEFATHHLNFSRNLHEWQANFSFYQTPNGNTGFEFFVELIHNRDLRFDYREHNLGIDRPNR